MAWWKQLLLSIVVLASAVIGWIMWVPSALPMLERAGIVQQLERIGVMQQLARLGVGAEEEPASPGGARPDAAAGAPGQPTAQPGRPQGAPQQQGQQQAGGPPRGGPPAGGPPRGGPGGFGGFGGPTAVIAHPVTLTVRNSNVTAIGTGQALRSVAITPEASGRIVEINIAAGDYVQAGTVLARLDNSAEDITLDRAELVLTDARATAERFARLQASGAATDIQIRDAELNLRKAELEYREAQLDLDRRVIVAPISGWVGFVDAELGDQVSTSTRLTGIDDRSALLVEFLVPERHVSALSEGMALRAAPLSQPGVTLDGRVRAMDNRVDEASRSLRVQAEIANAADALRPGMAFSITMEFSGESYPAVDPLAIQWSSNGAFVWAVREDQAQRVPIRIVQRNADIVLVEGALTEGDLVITEGVQSLRPGGAVRVQNAPAPAQQDGAAEQARAGSRAAPI